MLPSVKEGWGLVVIEAARMGTPTVAYASAGGTRESVRHGDTGVLVEDESDFRAAIAALLADPDEVARLSSQALAFAERFSWENSVRGVEAELLATAALRR